VEIMTIGIYKITFPGYSNKAYIGRSVNMEKRWSVHLSELKKKCHHNHKMQRVFTRFRYRDNFQVKFEIVQECAETDLASLEQVACDLIPRRLQFNHFAGVDDYFKRFGWKKKMAKKRKAAGRTIK
jgi:GIY-YIG catalytic domain